MNVPRHEAGAGISPAVNVYATAADAYRGSVEAVITQGRRVGGVREASTVGSHFGTAERSTLEVIGSSFEILSPDLSLPVGPSRRPDIAFAIGHLLWVLAGSSDLAWIRFYNPKGELFSDDGQQLHGAVGPRLGDGLGDIHGIVDRLRRDPSSRRAIVPLIYPDDLRTPTRDVPCGLAIQFFVRDNQLWAHGTMRSQSAIMLLPYDLFLFRALQHLVSTLLDVRVGPYIHSSNSLHIYRDEEGLGEQLLTESCYDLPFRPMLRGISQLDSTISLENAARRAALANDHYTLHHLVYRYAAEPIDFWDEAKLVVLHKAARTLVSPDLSRILESHLRPPLRDMIAMRESRT